MSDNKERTAHCCCGDVSITVTGEPHFVHGCHCHYCQRRTGSVWQVSCWFFDHEILSMTGDTQVYTANSESNNYDDPEDNSGANTVDYHFCKRCGSTVFWKIPMTAEMTGGEEFTATGIAVGCFTDQDFPKPISNHYLSYRPKWTEGLQFKYERDRIPSNEEGMAEMMEGSES